MEGLKAARARSGKGRRPKVNQQKLMQRSLSVNLDFSEEKIHTLIVKPLFLK